MNIYFVRHGQTDSNKNKTYNTLNESLNKTGVEQVNLLSNEISKITFDAIYCSPLFRTKQTCKILNKNNINVIYDDRLKEREYGSLASLSITSINREIYWNYYNKKRFSGEELAKEVCDRVASFITDLKKVNYNNVLVVSHNGIAKGFMTYFNGVPEDGILLKYGIDNAEMIKFQM